MTGHWSSNCKNSGTIKLHYTNKISWISIVSGNCVCKTNLERVSLNWVWGALRRLSKISVLEGVATQLGTGSPPWIQAFDLGLIGVPQMWQEYRLASIRLRKHGSLGADDKIHYTGLVILGGMSHCIWGELFYSKQILLNNWSFKIHGIHPDKHGDWAEGDHHSKMSTFPFWKRTLKDSWLKRQILRH